MFNSNRSIPKHPWLKRSFLLSRTASPLLRIARCGAALILLCFSLVISGPVKADEDLPAVFSKAVPESPEDLKAIQDHVRKVLEKVIPATVNVRVGPSQGSGVIVGKEGYVLTAGHVSGRPDRKVTITLHDGKRIKGITLGANRGIDSGLIKITEEGDWPYVEMGHSADLEKGQWVIATGHPGGFRPGRSPVVRVGRVVSNRTSAIRTDCSLVGGDSGGPLFDMHGRVVGIHSRIGMTLTANHHVPIDTYHDTWDRLVKGESWGGPFGLRGRTPRDPTEPYYGIQFDPDSTDVVQVLALVEGGPAEKAGLKSEDIVLKVDGKSFENLEELRDIIKAKKPGDEVPFTVRRGEAIVTIRITAGTRPE